MTNVTHSRRGIIAALAVAPLAACVSPALAGAKIGSTDGISPDLARLIERWRDLQTEEAHYYDTVVVPANDALDARVAAIPHYRTKRGYESQRGFITMSSDDPVQVGLAKSFSTIPSSGTVPDFQACCEELHAAVIDRQKLEATLREQSSVRALNRRSDEMGDISYAAWAAVRDFPVKRAADLFAIIGLMRDQGVDLDHDDVLASVSALLGDAV